MTSESGYVSRRTDRRTLEIFEMVYCGQLNKMWVEKFQTAGINAVGLSGLDGRIFEGTRKSTIRVRVGSKRLVIRDDWTGTVERVNTDLLRLLLDAGYLPVLTPPGASDAASTTAPAPSAKSVHVFLSAAIAFLSRGPTLPTRRHPTTTC